MLQGLIVATLAIAIATGCGPATKMVRPAHVPVTTWDSCAAEADRRMGLAAATAGMNTLPTTGPMGTGMAGGAVLGMAAQGLTSAMAPDAATADAWGWNHVMNICLGERGIRLP